MSVLLFVPFLIVIPILIFYVYLIIKVIQDPNINDNSKIFWVILLLVGNIIGLIVYLVVPDKNILSSKK
ncbi:MAG: PLDc N-terminal domain-containing protein [Bacilli bacterium]|nr:PLDc N-terminal domain-containing protein [Bacilli bacterium]